MTRPPLLPEPALARAAAGDVDLRALRAGLAAAGLDKAFARALAGEAVEHAERWALEDRNRAAVTALGLPTYELPFLPDAVDLGGLYELAERLRDAGHRVPVSARAARSASGHDRPREAPRLDLDAVALDPATRIVVCCGSGGVGKTTTAAAIALRAAEQGRKVVVLTIDPARRLAQSMGLSELDNTPREVSGVDTAKGGELHAMMLDMKRTFDEIVSAHSTPDRAEQILANPFYQSLSSSFAGTQEYMAMEKLGQLRAPGRVGPDRRRHPAVPVGAGLPGRPAAAGPLPRRPDAPAAAGAGAGRRPGLPEGASARRSRSSPGC